VAVSLGSAVLAEFETNGVGLQNFNTSLLYNNYSYANCLVMLAISFTLFLLLGLYLDNTLPSAYGLRKGWCFCCTRAFCCGGSRRKSGKTTPRKDDSENEEYFETKYMPRANFEPVSREL
jgi:hypothetical protein